MEHNCLKIYLICVISGFLLEAGETCSLLGYCEQYNSKELPLWLRNILERNITRSKLFRCLPQIGVWKSWKKEGLDIKDIVWPGNTHSPPQGVPEKFHLKIAFLEEPPYINLTPPDPLTGKCTLNKGVFCRYAGSTDIEG